MSSDSSTNSTPNTESNQRPNNRLTNPDTVDRSHRNAFVGTIKVPDLDAICCSDGRAYSFSSDTITVHIANEITNKCFTNSGSIGVPYSFTYRLAIIITNVNTQLVPNHLAYVVTDRISYHGPFFQPHRRTDSNSNHFKSNFKSNTVPNGFQPNSFPKSVSNFGSNTASHYGPAIVFAIG